MAGVAHQHNGFEVFAAHQVIGHHLLPADLVLLGHSSVTIARQVGQHGVHHALFAQRKQVDVLGAPGSLGRKGQLFLLRQRVDTGGFACVRAADKRNFRYIERGQEMQLRCGR